MVFLDAILLLFIHCSVSNVLDLKSSMHYKSISNQLESESKSRSLCKAIKFFIF